MLALALLSAGCITTDQVKPRPTVVHEFPDQQLTGVAVSKAGRVFVNFPRWSDEVAVSVAEILADKTTVPFPNEEWNRWDDDAVEAPAEHFVCVQSVYVDSEDTLWILDPAAPNFGGVIEGGPKLVKVDLAKNEVARVYEFDAEMAPENSYLNDVRVDPKAQRAYITDSGLGALVVVDLESGDARRVLADHPSTKAEEGVVPRIAFQEWRTEDGEVPQIHADGIALDLSKKRLFYHALTGLHLYSVPTKVLNDPATAEEEIAEAVTDHGETWVADGLLCDKKGNVYHTAPEKDAVAVWGRKGKMEIVVDDMLLAWPDSLAWAPDGTLYITTSQIHTSGRFPRKGGRVSPYRVWQVDLKAKPKVVRRRVKKQKWPSRQWELP